MFLLKVIHMISQSSPFVNAKVYEKSDTAETVSLSIFLYDTILHIPSGIFKSILVHLLDVEKNFSADSDELAMPIVHLRLAFRPGTPQAVSVVQEAPLVFVKYPFHRIQHIPHPRNARHSKQKMSTQLGKA